MFHITLLSTLQVSWMQEYLVYLSIYHPKNVADKFVDSFEALEPAVQRYLNYNHHAPFVHGSMNNKDWPLLSLGVGSNPINVKLDVLNNTQWVQVFEQVAHQKVFLSFQFNRQLPVVYLTGYGVELVVKSTEYSVSDDRIIKNTFHLQHNEEDVDQVLFKDVPTSITKLKNEDDLNLKAWSYILSNKNTKSRDKFKQLVHFSQNFPIYKSFISKQDIHPKIKSAIHYNTQHRDTHGIFINGLNIHEDLINSAGIDALIREEFIISKYVKEPSLLYTEAKNTKPSFQLPNPTWLNDCEDENVKFKSFPTTLKEGFQMWQFYRQMMPVMPIQKNIINIVLISNLIHFKHVASILEANVALHIGIIPIPYTKDHPGLSYILHKIAQQDNTLISKFITFYATLTTNEASYKVNCIKACNHVMDCSSIIQEYITDLKSLESFALLFDLKPNGTSDLYWMNGLVHPIHDDFEQSVIQNARSQYNTIYELYSHNQLDDDTDYFEFFNIGFQTNHPILNQTPFMLSLLNNGNDIIDEIAYLQVMHPSKHLVIIHCQFINDYCLETISNSNHIIIIDADDVDEELVLNIPLILNFIQTCKNGLFINGHYYPFYSALSKETINDLINHERQDYDKTTNMGLKYAIHRMQARQSPYFADLKRVQLPKLKNKIPLNVGPRCVVNITAVIDPFTEQGQKYISILNGFVDMVCLHIHPIVNNNNGVNRFYRYLHPSFKRANHSKTVSFKHLPKNVLLTSQIDAHPSWVIQQKRAVHDLDNIVIVADDQHIYAEYELKHLLIEGHVFDSHTKQPPSGLQLQLKGQDDTIVMSNLGYFQLKANPGEWMLQLHPGKSSDIYNITSVEDAVGNMLPIYNSSNNSGYKIMVDSFEGKVLFPKVDKLPGKQDAYLIEPQIQPQGSWFSSSTTNKQEKSIHIFSVASGHLYERFLSIMVKSVLMHTTSKVKLWLIEDFLSPNYKVFLNKYAKEYNFEYEFVTYKWPSWLRPQKEKQRQIWGYKILFLDVLFPLQLDRIIFVDSDQIVRTDLQELMDLDLNGKPYAYTPFCTDAREETKSFRFWETGYWKGIFIKMTNVGHLGDKPYHISALYVVDLKRFRQFGAGDLLRGQYQSLTADPNSLANLDQDLPNNMQDKVPIYSLPQEWLYCETWCSDAVFEKAKTIDLCNNPLTKEPKLARAKRQIKEWSVYDDEIAAFAKTLQPKKDDKDEL